MRYAIFQKDLSIPPVERLMRAFEGSGFLTPLDAHTFARDAFGILVRNLDKHQATQIHQTLLQQASRTRSCPSIRCPNCPRRKFLQRVDCLDQHLLLYDPLGRAIPLNWGHLMVIAAGCLDRQVIKRVKVDRPNVAYLEAMERMPRWPRPRAAKP